MPIYGHITMHHTHICTGQGCEGGEARVRAMGMVGVRAKAGVRLYRRRGD